MSEFGKIVGDGEVRLERVLPGPIERVWKYLTDPELRGKWLAPGPMEPRVGGAVALHFHHADLSSEKIPPAKYAEMECGCELVGEVKRFEPPKLLAYTWRYGSDESEVTFELTPQGESVLLVITHRRLKSKDDMANVAAGWHSHVGILEDQLSGREPRPFWSTHMKIEQEYIRRFGAELDQ